jgi:ESF2/ABP1 family protein
MDAQLREKKARRKRALRADQNDENFDAKRRRAREQIDVAPDAEVNGAPPAEDADAVADADADAGAGAQEDAPPDAAAEDADADADGAADESGALGASELAPERLAAFLAAERARGVCYLSSVPAGMRPLKLRHLLQRVGAIGRIFLQPEDAAAWRRRVRAGGSRRVHYTEGWVEFEDKHVARAAAVLLNGTPIGAASGSKKRGFFASDLWTIRFLKHFKWRHLAEKAAYERRVQALQLRNELAQARRQAERYVGDAEKARKQRARARERAAARGGGDGGGDDQDGAAEQARALEAAKKAFEQRVPLPDAQLRFRG